MPAVKVDNRSVLGSARESGLYHLVTDPRVSPPLAGAWRYMPKLRTAEHAANAGA